MAIFPRAKLVPLCLCLLAVGCDKRDKSVKGSSPSAMASAAGAATHQSVPYDRLLPGELKASSEFAFGFPIPDGMRTDRVFPTSVHLVGEIPVGNLLRYIQEKAKTTPPELQGGTFVFTTVRPADAAPQRQLRIRVRPEQRTIHLEIEDVTVTPSTEPPAQTDEERWRRAGMKPSGEPLDINQLR